MRYLFILLLVSGCASYQAQFTENIKTTLPGIGQTELAESWGAPFATGELENGMQFARYSFVHEKNDRALCQVDVLFQEDAAINAHWGGICAWDEEKGKPYALNKHAPRADFPQPFPRGQHHIRPAYMEPQRRH